MLCKCMDEYVLQEVVSNLEPAFYLCLPYDPAWRNGLSGKKLPVYVGNVTRHVLL
jgi:hypothetical protein